MVIRISYFKFRAKVLLYYYIGVKKILRNYEIAFLSPHILCLLIPNLIRVLLQKSTFFYFLFIL